MMVSGEHELRDGVFSVADELSGHRRVRWLLFFQRALFLEKLSVAGRFVEIIPSAKTSYLHESGRPSITG